MDVNQHLKKTKIHTSDLRSCVKVEVDALGSPSLIVLMVFAGVKQHLKKKTQTSELRSCVKVEVAVLGSPSPNSPLRSLWT